MWVSNMFRNTMKYINMFTCSLHFIKSCHKPFHEHKM
jgi:hypothetical protein